MDVGFAGSTREVVALLASHNELTVVAEDVNGRPNHGSEKGVAAIINRLALVDALALVVVVLNCPVTWPRAVDAVGRWTAVFPLFLVIAAEEFLCEDALLGVLADVKYMVAPFGRVIAFVVEGSLEGLSYAVVADVMSAGGGHLPERRSLHTNTALAGRAVHAERVCDAWI